MVCPFDLVHIHTFLEHFPKRAHFSQFDHSIAYRFDRIIDLLFSGKTSETETQ